MTDATLPVDDAAPRKGPSRGWYGLAFGLLLVGLAAFVASLGVARAQVQAKLDQMVRVVVPGEVELELTRAGRHLIYYERVGEVAGEQLDTRARFVALPKMNVGLFKGGTGEAVDEMRVTLIRSSSTESQMFNGGMASSEWEFESPGAGTYRLVAAHHNVLEDRLILAVGPPVADGVLSAWSGPFGGASVLAFCFVISTILFLVVWSLRTGSVGKRCE
ncbi:MAG: hypothetical protein V3V20_01990 [Algisphaera sp.]